MLNQLSDLYLRLKPVLDERGITMITLSRELGFSSSQLSDWKHDKRAPSAAQLAKIARYLDISTDYLLGLSPYPNTERIPDDAKRLIEIFLNLDVDSRAVVLSSAVQEMRKA